jgi:N-acetylmuramoyl-L-alanine amidase
MRHHRARFLHILAIAPVAAIVAGVLGPTPHALAAGSKAPVPIVVTVDPGHGGQPTPARPSTRFDPGAIGTNGLLEKDVDLDVGKRLAALLRADLVNVVMTRSTDEYVSPARRVQISTAHHAALVVSVHAASASDPQIRGSLVLYPARASAAFAQMIGDALSAQLVTEGLPADGTSLGDPAWIRSRVPTATAETGYLSNRADAALMAMASFRQDVAIGMRDGIEAYMPGIIARRDAIRAWRSGHPGGTAADSLAPASAVLPGTKGFQFGTVIAWLAGIAGIGLVLLFRDAVARILVVLGAVIVRLLASVMWLRRAAIRRKRRRQRAQSFVRVESPEPEQQVVGRRSSVYDDIPL